MPAAEFGVFDSAGIYSFAAAIAAVIGLDSAVVLLARRAGTSAASSRAVAGTALLAVIAAGTAVAALGIAAPALWSTLLFGTGAYAPVVIWGALSVPFAATLMYLLGLLKWEFRRGWFLASSLGSAVASVGLTYFVALHTDLGLPGLVAATAAGQAAGALVAFWGARDLVAAEWDAASARRLAALGLPFALIGVASAIAPSVDRLFLAHAHSLTDTAVYAVGQRIAMLQVLVLGGFQAAWGPFAFSAAQAPDKEAMFGRVLSLVCVAGAAFTLLLVLIAPWLASVAAGAAYRPAVMFVAPLGLATALGAVFFVVSIGAFLAERTVFNLYAYAAGVAVTIAANVALVLLDVPPLGIAWANCAGQATGVVLMASLSQRVHPIRYPFAESALVLAGAGAAGSWLAARPPETPAGLLAAMGTVVVIAGTWVWLRVLTPAERESARRNPGRPRQGS